MERYERQRSSEGMRRRERRRKKEKVRGEEGDYIGRKKVVMWANQMS